MKTQALVFLFGLCLFAGCDRTDQVKSSSDPGAQQDEVFSWNALWTADDYERTLKKCFPELPIVILVKSEEHIAAVVEDFENGRFLLVGARGWEPATTFRRNEERIEPPLPEEKIRIYESLIDHHGAHDNKSQIVSVHLGYWISLDSDDEFELISKIEWGTERGKVTISYNRETGWKGSIQNNY